MHARNVLLTMKIIEARLEKRIANPDTQLVDSMERSSKCRLDVVMKVRERLTESRNVGRYP